jgi:thiosulfate/3-mercaptopyruvate sulfurtransferase
MDWTTLVSIDDVAAALGDDGPVLVDCRFALADPDAGERAWREGHLPGAGYAHLDRDLSDHARPASEGRHPVPSAAAFRETLSRLGVTPDVQVVAYDAGDGAMAAARFWWLLRLLGHRRVAVLDGGFSRWAKRGLPIDADAVPHRGTRYDGEFDVAAIADTAEVERRLGDPPGWLLDARAPERFSGDIEPIDRIAGHIPGARNRPFTANLRDGRFRPAAEIRAEIEPLLAGTPPANVVLGCGSGVTACHLLLAMEHAGLAGARIYAPSWSGWISEWSRPVARGG